jgi:hypothetical protein
MLITKCPQALTKKEEVHRIHDALGEILDALIKHRGAYVPPEEYRKQGFVAIAASALMEGKIRSRKQSHIDNLYGRDPLDSFDPVGSALRNAIVDLGEHIYKLLGSVEGMQEVCARVCGENQLKLAIIDSAWNSIGEGDDRWWS